MKNNYFKVLRAGIHTTFQDSGFVNKQHLGITTGGVMDHDLYILSNKVLNNPINTAVIEFCFQGPTLKLMNGCARIIIVGNVVFNIKNSKETFEGIPYKSYLLKKGDIIDIVSTIKSNYGYLSIEGGFKIVKNFDSFSTLTTANIGSNNGKKLNDNQELFFIKSGSNINYKINFHNVSLNKNIRVIPGPQMNYFFPKIINKFFAKTFKISNNSNRMGTRLEGNICKAIKSHNIPSEGIIKGSIQVPGDGNPIILLNDHPTIGGYPKIAIVALIDIPAVSQLPNGTEIKFEMITLKDAEILYKKKIVDFDKQISNLDIK